MSSTKQLPSLTHLRPPYPEYRNLFFTDENRQPLHVGDARHGFRHTTKEFAMINAWWLAEAAGLVYDNFAAIKDRFTAAGLPLVTEFDTKGRADTQCYVAANEEFAVVAFRGTESDNRVDEETDFRHIFNDFQTDARARQVAFGEAGGQVHTGFSAALDAVWPALSAHLAALRDGRRTFWFTGHSLGGALATLALARSAEIPNFTAHGLYTFGSPLVGDAAFKKHFDGVLEKFGIEYYRFVNNQDLVPLVPPERLLALLPPPPKLFHYGHVGTLKFIDREGRIGGGLAGALDRILNFFGSLLNRAAALFNKRNPPRVRFVPGRLKDHVPMFYATHIWNAHVGEQIQNPESKI